MRRFPLYLPVELEERSRKKAFTMGIIKGRVGNLSGYIRVLIADDLERRPPLETNIETVVTDATIDRVSITFPKTLENELNNRAKELGFVRVYQGETVGNISAYIMYLLNKN